MSGGTAGVRLDQLLDRWFDEHRHDLIGLRRDLHAHPELSGDEHRSTATVTALLDAAACVTRPMSVGTGVIADLAPGARSGTGHAGRIAFRADLDALAMHDQKPVTYRSTIDGVSHSCGHDVHTTVVVGAAQFLAAHRDLLSSPVRFLFQPAEERVPGGALDVIRDGGLDDVATVVGLHCEPKLDVGSVGLRAGAITSAADMFTVTIRGPGGHTARPELTVDTVALAARVVTELPPRVAAATADAAVKVVFGAVHGGDAANAIPTSVVLRATARTPSLAAWEPLRDTVATALDDLLVGTGAEIELDYTQGVPPTVNDSSVIGRLRRAAEQVVGVGGVVEAEQSWGGDDFAWMTREVPGAYVRLGVHDPSGPTLDLHAGHFDVDERSIEIGVRLLVTTACAPDVPPTGS